jgi:hypothetical protein
VVATGDGIGFNVIYRDRWVTWPIQDIPFRLVLFAHYNPVDREAGFQPEPSADGTRGPTGTDDVLLYQELAEAVGLTLLGAAPAEVPLERRLHWLRRAADGSLVYPDNGAPPPSGAGAPMFDEIGRRRRGTGEHLVVLRPEVSGDRIFPSATAEVLAVRPQPGALWSWERVRLLKLTYQPESAGSQPE